MKTNCNHKNTMPYIYILKDNSETGLYFEVRAHCTDCGIDTPVTEKDMQELNRRLEQKIHLLFKSEFQWFITAERHREIDKVTLKQDTTGWDDLRIFIAKYAEYLRINPQPYLNIQCVSI